MLQRKNLPKLALVPPTDLPSNCRKPQNSNFVRWKDNQEVIINQNRRTVAKIGRIAIDELEKFRLQFLRRIICYLKSFQSVTLALLLSKHRVQVVWHVVFLVRHLSLPQVYHKVRICQATGVLWLKVQSLSKHNIKHLLISARAKRLRFYFSSFLKISFLYVKFSPTLFCIHYLGCHVSLLFNEKRCVTTILHHV